jgi:hypothetical protein
MCWTTKEILKGIVDCNIKELEKKLKDNPEIDGLEEKTINYKIAELKEKWKNLQ